MGNSCCQQGKKQLEAEINLDTQKQIEATNSCQISLMNYNSASNKSCNQNGKPTSSKFKSNNEYVSGISIMMSEEKSDSEYQSMHAIAFNKINNTTFDAPSPSKQMGASNLNKRFLQMVE